MAAGGIIAVVIIFGCFGITRISLVKAEQDEDGAHNSFVRLNNETSTSGAAPEPSPSTEMYDLPPPDTEEGVGGPYTVQNAIGGMVLAVQITIGYAGIFLVYPTIASDARLRRKPPYQLILSLGVSDLLSVTRKGFSFFLALDDATIGVRGRWVLTSIAQMTFYTMTFHLICIALSRLIYVVLPRFKRVVFSARNMPFMIAFLWIGGVCNGLVFMPGMPFALRAQSWNSLKCGYTIDVVYPEKPGVGWFTYDLIWGVTLVSLMVITYVPVLFKMRQASGSSKHQILLSLQMLITTGIYVANYVFWHFTVVLGKDWQGSPCVIEHMRNEAEMCMYITTAWIYAATNAAIRRKMVERFSPTRILPSVS